MAGQRGKIVFSEVPSRHVPLLIGRDFLDMGEKTLRIGTGVEKLGFREVNAVLDIPARLRERRKRQDSILLR